MKKIKTILFILLIIILIVACAAYIDYYMVKTRNTTPKISLKEDLDENLVVYNAILYRVWFCKTNGKYTIGDYKNSQVICSIKDSYDESGNYTNNESIFILKRDLDLMSIYFSLDQIKNMKQEDIDNAMLFAKEYGKIQYKKIILQNNTTGTTNNSTGTTNNTTGTTNNATSSAVKSKNNKNTTDTKTNISYDIVAFGEYILNENDSYELKYDETKQFCLNTNEQVASYANNVCGTFSKITINPIVCSLYKESLIKENTRLPKICVE